MPRGKPGILCPRFPFHVYNGDGQRVERSGSVATARYVWDGQNIHLRLNSSNALLNYYVYQPRLYGNLVASVIPLQHYFYNPLMSTEAVLADDWSLTGLYRYNAFGQILANMANF